MSSINTVFQPMGASIALVSGTPQQANPAPSGNLADCFRVVNTTAASAVTRLSWGRKSALAAVPSASGPNTMFLAPNESIYLCLPPDSWFNVAASGTVEITPGIGGAGG